MNKKKEEGAAEAVRVRFRSRGAHLEVFEQDVGEVGSLDKPAVRHDLGVQPLNHTAPQLVAVGGVANNCGRWMFRFNEKKDRNSNAPFQR